MKRCFFLVFLFLFLFGCSDSTPVSLSAELVTMSPQVLVIDVQTEANTEVVHERQVITTDSSGRARFEVRPDSSSSALSSNFQVLSDPLIGEPAILAESGIDWGFRIGQLADVPEAGGSWIVAFDDGHAAETMVLFNYEGDIEGLSRLDVATSGLHFMAPPGSRVTLGPLGFTVPDTGYLRWRPTSEELLQLFHLESVWFVPFVVESPEQAPASGRFEVNTRAAGERQVAEQLQSIRSATPALVEDPVDGFVLTRLDGTLHRGLRSGASGERRYDEVAYYAVEEEVSRVPGESCLVDVYSLVDRNGNVISAAAGGTNVDREHITSRVTVYRGLSTEVLASEVFEPPSTGPCERLILPHDYEIKSWVREQLPSERRRRRR